MPMTPVSDTIAKIKATAQKAVPAMGSAILYGSRARGDAHKGSDWDILILLDKEKLSQADYDKIGRAHV